MVFNGQGDKKGLYRGGADNWGGLNVILKFTGNKNIAWPFVGGIKGKVFQSLGCKLG